MPTTAELAAIRLRASGLPEDYATGRRGFTDLPPAASDAVAMCQLLGQPAVPGLYLWGPAGTFKTSVAASQLVRQIYNGAVGVYVYVPDLMDEILASYADDADETAKVIIQRLVDTPHLVLDDLGKEKRSEHSARRILQILDGRYRRRAGSGWLVVTSNDPITQLCEGYHENFAGPIARRLSEMTVKVPMERAA